MPSDFAASSASLNFAADEMSGRAAPFCTASAIADLRDVGADAGHQPALLGQIVVAVVGDDGDVVGFAVGHHLGDPRRGPEGKRKRVAGGALELRRELVERRLHGGGGEHLDFGCHAVYPGSMPLAFITACAAGVARNLMSARAASGCLPLAGMPAVR